MESRLNGLAISKNTGAVNGTLRAINCEIPETETSIVAENPVIAPSEKVKIGDCLVGSNGCVGQITNISTDSSTSTTSITITGLGFSVSGGKQEDTPTEILFSDLKNLVLNSGLVPGQKYKIIDYEATLDSNIDYATIISHPFDIIVTAKNESELYENAKASKKENDNYYNEDLNRWDLKYTLSKFLWSDASSGYKGTIFWMRDGNGNECPYDFKQIAFKRYKVIAGPEDLIGTYSTDHIDSITVDVNDYEYLYTFYFIVDDPFSHTRTVFDGSNSSDENLFDTLSNNVIKPYIYQVQRLNNITICGGSSSNVFNENCRNISLGNECLHNEFSNSCRDIIFGTNCCYNRFFNTDKSDYETRSIAFSNNCSHNTFNGAVSYILFNGQYICNNEFGNNVSNVVILNNSHNNIFKSGCNNTSLGEYSMFNTFGFSCAHIFVYGLIGDGMDYAKYFRYNSFGDGSKYFTMFHEYESESEQEENPIQYCVVLPGTSFDESSPEEFEVPAGATACTIIGSIYSN